MARAPTFNFGANVPRKGKAAGKAKKGKGGKGKNGSAWHRYAGTTRSFHIPR
jgi:hypothetical protein